MSSGFTNTSNVTHGAKVPKTHFTALIWATVAVSLCFVIFRGLVRLRVFRRFFLDDALVLLAWLIFLANVILYQEMTDNIYLTINVYAGLDYLRRTLDRYVCAIKAAFLSFFKRLGHHVKGQNVIWWIVTVSTAAGFFICVGCVKYRCTTTSDISVILDCATPSAINRNHMQLTITTAFDIITDILILALPINLLWNVRISIRQKLALAGIFSLTTLIIAVSLARVIVLLNENQIDISFLFTWFVVEQVVAIIIACLASYRVLFTKDTASQRLPDYRNGSDRKPLQTPRYYGGDSTNMRKLNSTTVSSGRADTRSPAKHLLPVGGVHVMQEYSVFPSEDDGL